VHTLPISPCHPTIYYECKAGRLAPRTMGNSISTSLRNGFTSCLNVVGAVWVNMLLGLSYTVFLGLAATSIVLIMANDGLSWHIAFGFGTGVGSAVIHFAIMLGALGVVDGYVLYPVAPRFLFASADVVIGLAFGLVTGGYVMDSTATTLPIVSSFMFALAYGVMCYKIAVILIGVVNRTRDPRTGELLDTPLPRG